MTYFNNIKEYNELKENITDKLGGIKELSSIVIDLLGGEVNIDFKCEDCDQTPFQIVDVGLIKQATMFTDEKLCKNCYDEGYTICKLCRCLQEKSIINNVMCYNCEEKYIQGIDGIRAKLMNDIRIMGIVKNYYLKK